ncbi:uncharacterized protein LAESUDRAFT_738542 [Laetiporus sulphureus 93-53]|uniref:Integrase core domain-containing protein n=1 Tax=Laetiporus sulphureus 93-53 TaxID=1314785 RepID=A0A165CIJ3_9APHY|nr:uncharacterized protein LAESUDRAFT_738542 [Laetiporus sulphureus 93-53]KZT02876.1 hypothetical protein LAESUDRAFT_738542 [Laetiporus sulphureus 93-53]
MEQHRGSGQGSYIWGWCKWKTLFLDLEAHCGLNPTIAAHVWLLHHLFLAAINHDAQDWASAWNSHHLQIHSERERSPRDMFFFSMVQDGPRGLRAITDAIQESIHDIAAYGIDWEVADDPVLMNHLLQNNPQDWAEQNPFTVNPSTLSDVTCEPPDCPLTTVEIEALDTYLASVVDLCRVVWQQALTSCNHLINQRPQNVVQQP